jgi:hypothetical protein
MEGNDSNGLDSRKNESYYNEIYENHHCQNCCCPPTTNESRQWDCHYTNTAERRTGCICPNY